MSTNKFYIALSTALLLTSACSSEQFISHNGNMPAEEKISAVRMGADKDQVLSLLGAPSSVVSLNQNTWIYMSYDVKKVAFFEPEEINRDVLKIEFNDQGKVVAVNRLNKEDGNEVVICEDKTETLGQEPGILQKTFGTLGGTYSPFMSGPGSSNP